MKANGIKFGMILMVSAMLFGCSSIDQTSKDAQPSEGTKKEESTDAGQATTDEMDLGKYNSYVDFSNSVSNNFYGAFDSYFSYFGDGETLTVPDGEPNIYSLSTNAMDKAFENVDKKPTYAEIDPLVKQMQPIYKELSENFTELEAYYKAKTYVDDNYQKAKDLHPIIIEKARAFDALYAEFDAKFAVIIEEVSAKDLERAKNNGYLFSYANMKYLATFKSIVHEIEKSNITDETIATSDISKIQPLYDELVLAYTDIIEKSKDAELMTFEGYDMSNLSDKSNVEGYIDKATAAKVSVTDFIQQVKSGETFSEVELSLANMQGLTSPDGSVGSLYYHYDELISAYNRLVN